VPKATLVSFRIDLPSNENVVKFGFLRQLGLQSGEVDILDTQMAAAARDLLRAFGGRSGLNKTDLESGKYLMLFYIIQRHFWCCWTSIHYN